MDLTKEAIEFLTKLGEAKILDVNGQKYSTKTIEHVKNPTPYALRVRTLTGLIDYIRSNIDYLQKDELLIHVVSPAEVNLYSTLQSDMERHHYINCVAQVPNIRFEQFLPVEQFNIMMQSCFIQNECSRAILKVIGNIREEEIRTTGDDGISQVVTAKIGIAKVGDVLVPNPVILKPYRTFTEIEQPESMFIFRMKDGPQAALFEADGGAWRAVAMKRIKEFLELNLKDTGVKIIS